MFVEDFGGESLKIWMQQTFSIAEFLRIAIATTESLQQIHSAHIIHKDINPSNSENQLWCKNYTNRLLNSGVILSPASLTNISATFPTGQLLALFRI